jgi:hypothetical protein
MEIRYINKSFYCYNCTSRFKKLVPHEESVTTCPNCNFGFAQRLEEGEFNREELDRTYRLQFTNGVANNREYHPVTDVRDRDPRNIYADPIHSTRVNNQNNSQNTTQTNRQTSNQQSTSTNVNAGQGANIPNGQQPRPLGNRFFRFININPPTSYLFFSPFNGTVNRQDMGFNLNNLFDTIFIIPTAEVFSDNFSSNFNSNFTDPLTRIIFIQSMNESQPGRPPASKEAVKNLKRFKMSEEYCKKDEKGTLEYPTCSVCMCEIKQEDVTVLIPCGHLYHDQCIAKWFDTNNTCPVCRYELPTEDPDYRNNNQTANNTSRVGNTNANRTF